MSSTIVTTKGTLLELDGSFSPRWGDGHYPGLSKVLSNPDIVRIRLKHIDFSRLEQAFVTLLGNVLRSRIWDRSYMAYCQGTVPDSCLAGLMQTKELEIYGSILNLAPYLGKSLAADTFSIESLRLRCRFSEKDMLFLAAGIENSAKLQKLYLTCDFPDEASAHLLADCLAKNQNLQLLSMYSCELADEVSMEIILAALISHPGLVTLELRDNNRFATTTLSSIVRHTKTIENLDLYIPPAPTVQTQSPRLDTHSFASALKENKSIKSLALANNALQASDVKWLSLALRSNKTLRRLNLQGNLIDDEGVKTLAGALPEMSLTELCLWNNPFTAKGAQALVEGLRHQNTILQSITTFSRYPCSAEIQYFTHLNRAGRQLLKANDGRLSDDHDWFCCCSESLCDGVCKKCQRESGKVPLGLWPIVLGRVNEQHWPVTETASILFTLLKEGPFVLAT